MLRGSHTARLLRYLKTRFPQYAAGYLALARLFNKFIRGSIGRDGNAASRFTWLATMFTEHSMPALAGSPGRSRHHAKGQAGFFASGRPGGARAGSTTYPPTPMPSLSREAG